ncbi:MAG: hypothetical protein Kow0069_20630 [Promethearchaeota archaeon]
MARDVAPGGLGWRKDAAAVANAPVGWKTPAKRAVLSVVGGLQPRGGASSTAYWPAAGSAAAALALLSWLALRLLSPPSPDADSSGGGRRRRPGLGPAAAGVGAVAAWSFWAWTWTAEGWAVAAAAAAASVAFCAVVAACRSRAGSAAAREFVLSATAGGALLHGVLAGLPASPIQALAAASLSASVGCLHAAARRRTRGGVGETNALTAAGSALALLPTVAFGTWFYAAAAAFCAGAHALASLRREGAPVGTPGGTPGCAPPGVAGRLRRAGAVALVVGFAASFA